MGTFFSKRSLTIICIFFAILFLTFLGFQHIYANYTIKKRLTTYQISVMKSTINNLIEGIDALREAIKTEWDIEGRKYTEDDVKKKVEIFVRRQIYKTEYPTGSYLWINEVRDFNGGDNYAVRLVHANLPETEGIYLSTNTKDEHGNFPYLTELEGVRENGSIIYNYYFKELNSSEISEKFTYAKLYPDYNWILCVGTYVNSLYEYAGGLSGGDSIFFIIGYVLINALLLAGLIYVIIQSHLYSVHLRQENKRLNAEVETDEMTGAASRVSGTRILQDYLREFIQHGNNHNIAMFDIDKFKLVNDRYGHNIGDKVIIDVIKAVSSILGQSGKIVRWGGDEFVILFYKEFSQLELKRILGKMNKKANAIKFTTEDGIKFNVSISIGAGKMYETDSSIFDTIKRIDDALYLAKRDRNTYRIMD